VGEKIESIKGANIISKPLSFVNAEFQRPLLQPINPQKGMTAVPMNLLSKEEMSNLLPIGPIHKSYIAAKKQINKKDKSGKRRYLGLKGFLMMVVGVILFFTGAEAWSYVLMGLGLLMFGVGFLLILYGIF
jgi:hypothetical protein